MNVDSIRRYCLSFSGAGENLQWGDDLCFKIAGKIFAILGLDSVPPRLCFKCTPEKFAALVEIDGITPAPYVGRYQWVLLESLDVLRDQEIKDLIHESYALVSAKMKGKKRSSAKGRTSSRQTNRRRKSARPRKAES